MNAPRRMPPAATLSKPDLHRLERLAKAAGITPARILKTVLRDGFEYTEWFVRQVNEGEADLEAGRVLSTAEVLSLIERQRASRGRQQPAPVSAQRPQGHPSRHAA